MRAGESAHRVVPSTEPVPFQYTIDDAIEAGTALANAEALWAEMRAQSAPSARLYAAPLTGRALVLGRWQRAATAIDAPRASDEGLALVRRRTGGPAVYAGEGTAYAALILRHASVLLDCPADRVLNRNVRGMLGALSKVGSPAHYFGREWLSIERRPVAVVGWARHADGSVLLEFFLSIGENVALEPAWTRYPTRAEPPFLGKEPIRLDDVAGRALDPVDVLSWLPVGHAERFPAITPAATPLEPAIRERAKLIRNERSIDGTATTADDLLWSRPHEVPIGFVEAGLRLDSKGQVERARIAGDVFMDDGSEPALEESLRGRAPTPELIAAAINTTFDQSNHVMEGIRSLQPLLEGFTELAADARHGV